MSTTLRSGVLIGLILLVTQSLRAEPPAEPQSDTSLVACWDDLRAEDGTHAYQAIRRLATEPDRAIPLLRVRLLSGKPTVDVAAMIADLDHRSYRVRQHAMKKLEELGPQAERAMLATLQQKPTLEVRRRIEVLLRRLDVAPTPVSIQSPQHLQALRAIEVLERIGNAEAKEVLRRLAGETTDAVLRRTALTALDRLRIRS